MNLFEKFVYQLIRDEVSPHPAPEDCPAIKAERNGETSQEVVRICLNCFENLKKQKEKPMTTFEEKIYPILNGILPNPLRLFICFISSFVCSNCFISWLTS